MSLCVCACFCACEFQTNWHKYWLFSIEDMNEFKIEFLNVKFIVLSSNPFIYSSLFVRVQKFQLIFSIKLINFDLLETAWIQVNLTCWRKRKSDSFHWWWLWLKIRKYLYRVKWKKFPWLWRNRKINFFCVFWIGSVYIRMVKYLFKTKKMMFPNETKWFHHHHHCRFRY